MQMTAADCAPVRRPMLQLRLQTLNSVLLLSYPGPRTAIGYAWNASLPTDELQQQPA